MPFTDQVAIVTGASAEIGASIAVALGRAGARVLLSYHAGPGVALDAQAQIQAAGGQAALCQLDLTRVDQTAQLVALATSRWGRLDVLVANAGLTHHAPFLDTTEAAFDAVVNLNLKGSFFAAQAAARAMIQGGRGGRIIFSSSVTGTQALPGFAAYGVTKAALQHMARTLGSELGRHGITVNALGIGATSNVRNRSDDPRYDEHWRAVIPTRQVGLPQHVADAVLFLASAQASMVNGHTLMIDGGWSDAGLLPPPD
ncbi:SDR family oxidoreductase [Deinococcus sp. KSM4-11]|uniref:SDR family NAD(P)-dependent oxidoreductase n=1 Tax=Deinococcus sp. KSM4-11 TaxID=2568654 RepID=UPI0010A4C11C|nr:SDR family NAD(P)-dependent oxidoreductase [Deinococcus sp. KSM4-11]THF84398.1 SDR family oxidoreductase [Deinococcus sp. KSM4-11]